MIDFGEKNQWHEMSYPNDVQHVLAPCSFDWTGSFVWFSWDSEAKQIRVQPNKKNDNAFYVAACQSKPLNNVTCDSSSYCFFDRASEKIIIARRSIHLTFPQPCHHPIHEDIDSISSFSYEYTTIIVTWSVDSKASSVYYGNFGRTDSLYEWVNHARINWFSKECSIPFISNYVLKPVNNNDDDVWFLIEDNHVEFDQLLLW